MSTVDNKVLYTGVTSDSLRSVAEHRQGTGSTFTSKFIVYKPVYFERGGDIVSVINREKQIKARFRANKDKLIKLINPEMEDLAEDWY